MARVAKIDGTHLHTIKIAQGVNYHLTSVESPAGDAPDLKVTPEIFGKVQNSAAYSIPSFVVDAIRALETVTAEPVETKK